MSYAGQDLADSIVAKARARQKAIEELARHSDFALETELNAYRVLWEKEDSFMVVGEKVDEEMARERAEVLLDCKKNFKISLVRRNSDCEGVMRSIKKEGWTVARPVADQAAKEGGDDDSEGQLASDEEWEYYSDSDEEEKNEQKPDEEKKTPRVARTAEDDEVLGLTGADSLSPQSSQASLSKPVATTPSPTEKQPVHPGTSWNVPKVH